MQPLPDQVPGVVAVDLVLGGAGQGDFGLDAPQRVVVEGEVGGHVAGLLELLDVLANPPPPDVLQLHHPVELGAVDALGIDDEAVGVGEGEHLAAVLEDLLGGVLRDVARPGDQAPLTLDSLLPGVEHLEREVDLAVAGGLGPDQRPAPGQPLAGEHPFEAVGEALVLAEEEADLPPADADVAGRHVGDGADVAEQLGHERLTEPHHLVVRLTLGIEVRAPLATADHAGRQGVLEDLLEAQELEDAEVDRRMEAQTPLEGPQRAVELDAVAAVDLDGAAVVHPRHPEQDRPLRFHDPLERSSACRYSGWRSSAGSTEATTSSTA